MLDLIPPRVMLLLLLFSLLLPQGNSLAQEPFPAAETEGGHYSWDDFAEEYLSDEERAEEDDLQQHLLELKEMHEHPLNINTAGVDDLRQLPFLTDAQIEQIHAYIYLHGQMQTLAELRLVPLVDEATRRRLQLFVRAAAARRTAADTTSRRPHHDFSTRLDIPFYYRRGQMQADGYRGDPTSHRLRYQLAQGQRLQVGLHAEKDAGERYYDSYGGFVALRNVGIARCIVVGDYRIGFGEGLVMGSSSWSSKSAPPLRQQGGIRPMTSTDEVNFLRGGAVTLSLGKHVAVSLFGSHRRRDATLTDRGEAQTLLAAGYHRTETEWQRRGNTGSSVAGGNVEWHGGGFHMAAAGYWQHFSRCLNPGTQQYRAIYPRGKDFGAVGISYGYTRYRLSLAGETAYSTAGGGLATINRIAWNIGRNYVISAVGRFYAYQYYSFYGNALSENTNAQNESGVLLHLQAEPLAGLQLTAYADFFHHPWPRYRMTRSSTGQDFMLQATYAVSRRHTLLVRYQMKRKENADRMEPHHRAKMQWTFTPSQRWRWQTTAALHGVPGSTGVALTQGVRCLIPRPRLSVHALMGYFHTASSQSRIYMQLPALYSSVASAVCIGHGLQAVLTGRWQSTDGRWMLEARYGMSRYFDRREQGTGLQTIFSPWKNDLSVQLRVQI